MKEVRLDLETKRLAFKYIYLSQLTLEVIMIVLKLSATQTIF